MSKLDSEFLIDLLRSDEKPPESWIGPAFLPRRAKLLFGGEAKIGKSWNLLEFARALVTGTYLWGSLDFPVPEPCKVFLVEKELGPWELMRRARKTFEPHFDEWDSIRERLIYKSMVPWLRLDDDIAFKELRAHVKDTKPNIVMFDPMGKFADNLDGPTCVKIFHHMDVLMDDNKDVGLSVLYSHHYKKPPAENFRDNWDEFDPYNFRDSSLFYNEADSVVTMARRRATGVNPKDGWNLKVKLEGRRGPMPDEFVHLAVRLRPEDKFQVTRLVGEEDHDRPISRLAVM